MGSLEVTHVNDKRNDQDRRPDFVYPAEHRRPGSIPGSSGLKCRAGLALLRRRRRDPDVQWSSERR